MDSTAIIKVCSASATPAWQAARAYSKRAYGPAGSYVVGAATLIEFVFAPPAIALAIGAYINVQFSAPAGRR